MTERQNHLFLFKPDLTVENWSEYATEVEKNGWCNVRSCYTAHCPTSILEETDAEYLEEQRRWFNPCSQPRTEEEWEYVSCLAQSVEQRLYQLNSKATETEAVTEEKYEDIDWDIDFDEVHIWPCESNSNRRHVSTEMVRLQ